MVKLMVREVAESQGLTTAYQLQKLMGLPPAMAARLWKGELSMIGLDTVDRLCEALSCEPADLLVRVKEKKGATRKR